MIESLTPALGWWRRELAEGKRTTTTFDPLWRAACEEMSAIEHEEAGIPSVADTYRRRAREIIKKAARGEAA